MNIDDIPDPEVPKTRDILPAIFEHQAELMVKYDRIERENGILVPQAPWHIDDRTVQERIKHLFWCVTEEIGEALEKRMDYHFWQERWEASPDIRHFFEELADAVHFLVEASIIAGMDPKNLTATCYHADLQTVFTYDGSVRTNLGEVIFSMGLAANFLKMKAWKQTDMPTDIPRFNYAMYEVWHSFFKVWLQLEATLPDLYTMYFKKNRVNQFRQESKY